MYISIIKTNNLNLILVKKWNISQFSKHKNLNASFKADSYLSYISLFQFLKTDFNSWYALNAQSWWTHSVGWTHGAGNKTHHGVHLDWSTVRKNSNK